MAQKFAIMGAGWLAEKGVEMIFKEKRRRKEESTRKALEYKIDEYFQKLKKKMEDLQEYFKKLQKFRQCECQLVRAELEKNHGTKEEENFARVVLSRMEEGIQILSQRIQTLQKDVQEWPETTKYELQLLRAELEKNHGKKEEEISRALEYCVIEKFKQLFQEMESLEKYLQKLLKSSQNDFQLLRADQEK